MDEGNIKFVYQYADKEGNPIELLHIVVDETSIGRPLDDTPTVMQLMKEAYKNAIDFRHLQQQREKEKAVSEAEALLRDSKAE